jgi:hypothetical protein
VAAIEEGRAVFENIRKFITYIHQYPEIVPIWPMCCSAFRCRRSSNPRH